MVSTSSLLLQPNPVLDVPSVRTHYPNNILLSIFTFVSGRTISGDGRNCTYRRTFYTRIVALFIPFNRVALRVDMEIPEIISYWPGKTYPF